MNCAIPIKISRRVDFDISPEPSPPLIPTVGTAVLLVLGCRDYWITQVAFVVNGQTNGINLNIFFQYGITAPHLEPSLRIGLAGTGCFRLVFGLARGTTGTGRSNWTIADHK